MFCANKHQMKEKQSSLSAKNKKFKNQINPKHVLFSSKTLNSREFDLRGCLLLCDNLVVFSTF